MSRKHQWVVFINKLRKDESIKSESDSFVIIDRALHDLLKYFKRLVNLPIYDRLICKFTLYLFTVWLSFSSIFLSNLTLQIFAVRQLN